jgi:radical SAM superfamily enzyme YgiQ (UPF0313 family)
LDKGESVNTDERYSICRKIGDMKKLLLIYPKAKGKGFAETGNLAFPPIALGYLAALTPPDWDIAIIDEHQENIDLNHDADLVGISVMTENAPRAYELCREFQKRNKKIVLGGVHVSMYPEEAELIADAIVVGEAENIWEKVLSDFSHNHLQKSYRGPFPSLNALPIPRRDLIKKKYQMEVIQTSRGCPYACEFCSVTSYQGATFRQRPVNDVLDELETISSEFLFFIDDNFFGIQKEHVERAIDICKGIIARKIRKTWITQTSVEIGKYPDAIKWARKAGCRGVLIGIETVEPQSWIEMKKKSNQRVGIEGVREAIRALHREGILILAPFIFGSDSDTVATFKNTVEFIRHAGIDVPMIAIMTPYPGTKLFSRLLNDNRIIHKNYPEDWSLYDVEHACHLPLTLSPTDLTRGVDYTIYKTYSPLTIATLGLKTFFNTKSIMATLIALKMNIDMRNINKNPRIGLFEE